MSRLNTQSYFGVNQGAVGIQQSISIKNQHEIVNKNKSVQELKQELDKEKESSRMYQKLLEKALLEIQQYINRFGSYATRDEDENDSRQDEPHIRQEFTWRKLEPLLLSFDETIAEQKHMIDMYKKDIAQLEQLSKSYVDENLYLRDQLERKCEAMLQIYQNGNVSDSMANLYKRIQKDDWAEKVKELSEENNKLVAEYKKVLGYLREKTRDTETLTQQVKDITQKYEKIKADFQQVSDAKNDLAKTSGELQEKKRSNLLEIGDLKKRNLQLEQDNQQLQITLEQTENNYQSTKRELDDVKNELERQIANLEQDVEAKSRKLKELQSEKLQQTKEKEQLASDLQNYKAKYFDLDKDSNKQKQKIEDLDRKISILQTKEEEHLKKQQQYAERENQQKLEIDNLSSNNTQKQQQIDTIQVMHKNQLEQFKNEKDRVIEQLRQKYKNLVDDRDNTIEELQQAISSKDIQIEKISKEIHRLKQEKEDMEQNNKGDRYKLDYENTNLKKKNQELEQQISRREQYYEDKLTGMKLDKEQLELQNKNQSQLINELKQQNEQLRKKTNLMEVENYELKERVTNYGRSQVQGTNSKIMRSNVPS